MYSYILAFLASLFSFQNQLPSTDLVSNYDPSQKIAIFNSQKLPVPTIKFNYDNVLGDSTTISNKRIEVNLTTQTLTAFENDQNIGSFTISSGTWGRTPVGTYTIWAKIKSQKMSGGSKELGTYFYLPNVPNILFFYNDKVVKKLGYSIHGAYWHNNFGVPMSHGCINMKIDESAKIFNWADYDTPIIIFGKYVY
jgi:lipoprotein-anchoring transpeptidase ErfK/SrfK